LGVQASFSAGENLPEDDEIFETFEAHKPNMRTIGLQTSDKHFYKV